MTLFFLGLALGVFLGMAFTVSLILWG